MTEPDTSWQRARSPEQIAERRVSILDATGDLLDEGGVEAAGLNAIARQVGLSKANLYRYFESREAILLELLLTEFRRWSDEVASDLDTMDAEHTAPIEWIARRLAARHAARPRLGMLFHALPGIIEHNISLETAIDFKTNALALMEGLSGRLERNIPGLSADSAARFLMHWLMAVCGAWPHCHPHQVINQAMQHLGKADLMQPYEETIYAMAVTMLHGVQRGL